MKTLKLPYQKGIDPTELNKLISFVSSDIQQFSSGDGYILLYLNEKVREEEVKEKFEKLVTKYCDTQKQEESYFQNEGRKKKFTSMEEIREAGFTKKYGDGLIGLHGAAIPLFRYFSAVFRKFGLEAGAEEKMYPTLLDTAAYQKTGYFKSSPQYVTFCCDVMEDANALECLDERFVQKDTMSLLKEPRFALSPSACFHTYLEYEGKELPCDQTVTFQQRVFRNEGRFNWNEFGRLRDYHVRELVFLGDAAYVDKQRKKIMEKTRTLMEKLELEGKLVSSSDPFIAPQMQQFKKLQVFQKNKYEARIKTASDKSIACASFNLHGVSFTKPFHIKVHTTDHPVTGCVGFGIERWVLAFLSQYGTHQENWPKPVRDEILESEEKKS